MLARVLPFILVAAATIGLDVAGGLTWLDNGMVELRMRAAPRPPTGTIAIVDIDARSLADVGTWPWPRSIHAAIVDRLTALGAGDIAFDVDFSAASDDRDDTVLADALARAGGTVVLSSFRQQATAAGATIFTAPLPKFAANAWAAMINVTPDADSRVRSLPYGDAVSGTPVPSLAAMLGGGSGMLGRDFLVDFSIAADQIDRISAIDVINGTVDPRRIAGKTLIVGASAIALRDFFTVPVHGVISGAVLQALGADSIRQGRALARTSDAAALALVIVFLAGVAFLRVRWTAMLAGLAMGALGIEAAAALIQVLAPLVVTTAPLLAAFALLAAVTVIKEIDVRAILLRMARVQTLNTQAILDRVVADNFAGVVVADGDGTVLAASRTATTFLNTGQGFVGRNVSAFLPPALSGPLFAALSSDDTETPPRARPQEARVIREGTTHILEFVVTSSRLEGGVSLDGQREADRTVACLTFSDVTERRSAEERLAYLARYDVLTGLANRNHFADRLSWVDGSDNTVVAISLDRFGEFTETFGHGVGDRLLIAVATRIGSLLRSGDLLARLENDTFVALLAGFGAAARAERLAGELIGRVGEPYALAGDRLVAALSFGIAWADRVAEPAALLKAAETALHSATARGGNTFVVFDAAMTAGQAHRQVLELQLWEAFERNEFEVYYQPQVGLRDGTVRGVEALLRWNHPKRGVVLPGEFIGLTETIGLIQPIGEWVLERACRDAARWPGELRLAVNVSPVQFVRGDLVAAVKRALTTSGLAPDRLDLEITESVFIGDRGAAARIIGELQAIGVGCALDDFGTGYSSLAYLRKFAVDKVKLDRSFIVGLPHDHESVAIVRAVGALAQSLGIRLLAEGVEREEQIAFLRLQGFSEGQGYLFGKPMREAEIAAVARTAAAAVAEAAGTGDQALGA